MFRLFQLMRSRVTIVRMKPSEELLTSIRPAWRRVRAVARRLAAVWPLTPLGMALFAVASIALFIYGFDKLDLVLLVLGYGGIGLLVLSTLVVLGSALGLRLWLRRAPIRWFTHTFETGAPLPTGFSLPSLWWLPMAQLRWTWVFPPAAAPERSPERGRLRERVSFAKRGIFESVRRRIVVQDAFGLSRIAFEHRQEGPLEVLPHLGGMRRLPVLTSLTGGDEYPHPMGLEDGDRVELRRYVPGDSARFIHWKVFGRTRKLMVRMPERSLSRARKTLAYLVAGPHDEASAAAARAAIEEEALGIDWKFGADGAPSATSDRSDAIHKIMTSSGFAGPSGCGLGRFLAEVDPQGPAALVVFAPPTMGPWLDELRSVTMRRYGRVRVVIAVDAVHEPHQQPRWRRLLLKPARAPGVGRDDLERVGRALSQLRCEVVIIDRVSGRVLGDGVHVTSAERRAA
ncbi:MAG: hypothetical protein AMJ62_11065 [Myxococcales bacterium SG8_38]|nr:MAG: hypothetical protein AMJ62_11065 [Myxococcales bacterium SG8_38]